MASRKREETGDLTVAILRSIRDEIRQLRTDTNDRFEALGSRFGSLYPRLGS